MTYINLEQQAKLRNQLLEKVPLSQYTSWKVGGLVDYLYQPADLEDLSFFLTSIPSEVPLFWLGHGTNVLISDQGIQGIVVLMRDTLQTLSLLSEGLVYAESGVASTKLAHFTTDLNLSGLEFLVGIPGTVGGALAINAGAYGNQIWDYVVRVKTIDRHGLVHERETSEYKIGYRSVFSPAEEWFVGGYFKLKPGNKEESLQKMKEIMLKRKASQPLHLPNAGSVFKNPGGDYAGRLIEACGLKGFRIGGACVSDIHANFIVNDNQASASDIKKLIEHVFCVVRQKTGIQLEREVLFLGG